MLILATPAFTSPTDIANRVLDHVGADHKITNLLTDVSKNQRLILGVYNKLRQAELQRNNWRFAIKKAVLRPVDTNSMFWTPPAWSAVTTYRVGQVVSYDDGYGVRNWINDKPSNLNIAPGSDNTAWSNYFGPLVAALYDTAQSYATGELVYMTDNAGSFTVYSSLMTGGLDDPNTTETWAATTIYRKDQVVTLASINYRSLIDENLNHSPDVSPAEWVVTTDTGSLQWVTQGGAVSQLNITWPIEAGPLSQDATKNVYPLPYGFLRKAPQDPKAGMQSFLGAPTNRMQDDWLFEGNYIVSMCSDPIVLRFIGDVTVVAGFDPMFSEGLGGRIAYELCEPITQSTEKMKGIGATYEKFMREARLVNGIEQEAEMPAEDDWITTRM